MSEDSENKEFKEWESILAGKGADNLSDVLDRGWEDLSKRYRRDVASYGLVSYDDSTGSFKLPFFNEVFLIDVDKREIKPLLQETSEGSGTKSPPQTFVSSFLATLLVHYLASVKNIEVEGKPLTFREVPGGGDVYYPAFQKNAIRPIIKRFGECPEELLPAGERLGGKPVEQGDFGVEIPIFPKIPVTVVVWSGDEEIPANANVLFDVTAKAQMHIEDLAVIGGVVAGKLVKYRP